MGIQLSLPIPSFDPSRVEITPLAAESNRVTIRVRHLDGKELFPGIAKSDLVVKWCLSRIALSELEANRKVSDVKGVVPLLGGFQGENLSLRDIFPGLNKMIYADLRTQINNLAYRTGGNAIRDKEYTLRFIKKQDVLVFPFIPDGEFSPERAASLADEEWKNFRNSAYEQLEKTVSQITQRGIFHNDPYARNLLVTSKSKKILIFDFGASREIKNPRNAARKTQEEVNKFMQSIDRVRQHGKERLKPPHYPFKKRNKCR